MSHQSGDISFLSRLNRGVHSWKDYPVDLYSEEGEIDLNQAEGVDLFFTPLTFDWKDSPPPKRSNDNAHMPSRVFFADLDHGFREPSLHVIEPNYLWRTSPGNYQAIWICRTMVPYHLWTDLNQRITYFMGADLGGWHPSKVLRVPGSINYKRAGNKVSDLLVNEPIKRISVRQLIELPTTVRDSVAAHYEPSAPPPAMTNPDWVNLFKTHWDIMPLGVRSRLMARAVQDRSLELFMLSKDLGKLGLSPSTVFHLLNGVRYNKFKNRPELLWKLVNE